MKLNILGIVVLIVLALVIIFTEDTINIREKREARQKAKQKKEVVITPENGIVATKEPVELTAERVVHVTYTTVPTDSSYWYVVMKDDATNWHGVVSLATPYFDFNEAKKEFDGAKGKGYFKFILQINKETVPTFYIYND